MTERVLGPTGGRRRKRLAFVVPFVVLAALILAIGASAGPIGVAAGFEDDDANLVDNAAAGIDWNTFATTNWSGTAPYLTSTKTSNGFAFTGIADAEAVTSDTNFNGGVKQDDDCAGVGTGKSSNKDDLKRIYVASKTGTDGHTYLELAWVRIPQNTTSPSAHVAFEFNQNDGSNNTGCGGTSPLVKRSFANGGDMLIVYDFEGGSGDAPHLTLRRWVNSGSCEVSSDSPPCWGTAVDLTNNATAEAAVNVSSSALDSIAPSSETLGLSEFGEAGIDLTNAGVFTPGICAGFGKVYGVSRSSGNSGTAQMKDLVGPGNISLTNCGTVKIIKQTDPRGVAHDFSFTSNLAGAQMTCTSDTTPASFTLNDTGNSGKTLGSTAPAQNSTGNTESCSNVPSNTYTVAEGADSNGFAFDSLTCTDSNGNSTTKSTRTATITVVGGGSTVCLYINKQQLGAIKVTKTTKKPGLTGAQPQAGVNFTVEGVTKATDVNGQACFDGLSFASHDVTETVPSGYRADGATTKAVTVDNNATCTASPYAGETVSFSNTPLTDVTITVNSQADGGTASTIDCEGTPGTTDPADGLDKSSGTNGDIASNTVTGLLPQTLTCTIVIDP